ncbi:malate dehydrogenase [Spirulina sp. CS-785/01]|uniref:malate dehydrogenase n=1 Tax=Spirulina sp. CS-785/01 TaxID=3021716 RepID=UPI00232DB5A1|nr:malate dehydrogenase [Spirulina sp. CS-785/01]MDB9312098.1 malate dehydrogenase [Spirulina sp. CS-785/01]
MNYSSTTSTGYRSARVTVVGAGKVGSTLAQRIIEQNLADVVLLDVVEGLPQGVALDLSEAQGLELHDRTIIGTNDYADTANSDLVILTAGLPRQPGMSRDDLIGTNAKVVGEAAKQAISYSPNAMLMLVTNPLDVMTYLAWKVTGLPPQRVIGMAGVLDSARLQTFIAMELGVSIGDVTTLVLGGHGDLMIPLPRYCTVRGVPLPELLDPATIERLTERTRNGGAELVKLYKRGGAYYAPSSSACLMAGAILNNQSRLLPAAVYLNGEYGLKDIFIGVPCRLGNQGVESILELKLTEEEQEALHQSAASVRSNIDNALASFG